MRILFLDDDVSRHEYFMKLYGKGSFSNHVVAVWNVEEAKEALDTLEQFDAVCLDHDLSGRVYEASGPTTGYAVAQHIVQMPKEKQPPLVFIHTMNPMASKMMLGVFDNSGITVRQEPFEESVAKWKDVFGSSLVFLGDKG